MAKYKLKNDKLWQWDSGQLVEVPTGYEGYESQFYNKNHKDGIVVPTSSYTTESTKTYCTIPNQLLADADDIAVFSFSKTTGVEHTETVTVLKVIERPKPSSYIYTPEEKKTWEQLSDRIADAEDDIDELDEGKADVNHTHDWDEIQDKPTEFPPSSHTHNQYLTDAPSDDKGYVRKNGAWAEESGATEVAWSDVTGKPTSFNPDIHGLTSVDTIANSSELPVYVAGSTNANRKMSISAFGDWIVTAKGLATKAWVNAQGFITSLAGYATEAWVEAKGYITSSAISDMATKTWVEAKSYLTSVSWSDIGSKPTEFTPSAHEQGWDTITGKPTTFTPSAHNQGWDTITDKPESYTPSSHTHAWSEVTGKPSTFTPSAHNHNDLYYTESEVDTLLDDKADVPSKVTSGTNITLADNTEYRLTNVSTLTIAYPSGNFECWLRITTASSGAVTITLPTSTYIGATPSFANGETWELSIKDGYVVARKCG